MGQENWLSNRSPARGHQVSYSSTYWLHHLPTHWADDRITYTLDGIWAVHAQGSIVTHTYPRVRGVRLGITVPEPMTDTGML